jgi:hypothetical protein
MVETGEPKTQILRPGCGIIGKDHQLLCASPCTHRTRSESQRSASHRAPFHPSRPFKKRPPWANAHRLPDRKPSPYRAAHHPHTVLSPSPTATHSFKWTISGNPRPAGPRRTMKSELPKGAAYHRYKNNLSSCWVRCRWAFDVTEPTLASHVALLAPHGSFGHAPTKELRCSIFASWRTLLPF